jgi:transposase
VYTCTPKDSYNCTIDPGTEISSMLRGAEMKKLIVASSVISALATAGIVSAFSQSYGCELGEGHWAGGIGDRLTEEQRDELSQRVQELMDAGATRQGIQEAIQQFLEEQGIGEDTLKEVMKGLVDQLVENGSINLVTVALDSSTLEASLKDTEAAWGYTREGSFYGYKVHFACCTDSELPVSVAVTPGNVHDSTQCIPLIRGARKIKKTILYMVADTAYDSLEIYETLMEKYSILPVVPFNPRNGEKPYDYGIQRLYYFETAFLKPLYRRRTAVERVNNIVTKELGLDYLRYKGLRAVTFQAYITCICQLAAALCAVLLGLKKDMRRISFFR